MTSASRVLWTKGVLLDPQHLQAQDRYFDSLLHQRLSMAAPYSWGLQRLDIDREALSAGTFALRSASGIFPDGLPFELPGSDAPPPQRGLVDAWPQSAPALDVYLAIPAYRPSGMVVDLAATGATSARYTSDLVMLNDETSGGGERAVEIAIKNLRLLVGGEAQDGYSVLPLARVVKDASGQLSLDENMIPPLLDVRASPKLSRIVGRLVNLLAAKSAALSGTRRQRNQNLASFTISDVASFWLLYNVNQALPVLQHLAGDQAGDPLTLYRALTSLAGGLTTFSNSVSPDSLPAYDHNDLTTTFSALDKQLRDLLESVVPSTVLSLPFRLSQPSIFATAIDDDRVFEARQLILAVRGRATRAELSTRVPEAVKLATADRIDHLIRHALPGLTMTYLETPPTEIAVKLDYSYFRIDKGNEWSAVKRARNLVVYVPDDLLAEVEVECLALLPT